MNKLVVFAVLMGALIFYNVKSKEWKAAEKKAHAAAQLEKKMNNPSFYKSKLGADRLSITHGLQENKDIDAAFFLSGSVRNAGTKEIASAVVEYSATMNKKNLVEGTVDIGPIEAGKSKDIRVHVGDFKSQWGYQSYSYKVKLKDLTLAP